MTDLNNSVALRAAADAALNLYVCAAAKAAPTLVSGAPASPTLRLSLQQLRLTWRELAMAADAAASAEGGRS